MNVVYATFGWGVHDDRWMDALKSVSFTPTAVSRTGEDAETFRAAVLAAAGGTSPVVAGPLDSVAIDLVHLPLPVIGLSWGYDIQAMSDLGWLANLRAVIVDSEANRRAVQAAGVPHERVTFLPWGVELRLFTPYGPAYRPVGVPPGAPIVLTLRAHEPKYRVDTAIEAFSHLAANNADVHLVVGHSGSLTHNLYRQSEQAGIADRVHFIGTVPEARLPALLRAADCYVSASEVDGTSVTLLQAMACDVPVAVSAIDGNRPWVGHGRTGYLFAVGDAHQARDAIAAALSAPSTVAEARAHVCREADWCVNTWRLRRALLGT